MMYHPFLIVPYGKLGCCWGERWKGKSKMRKPGDVSVFDEYKRKMEQFFRHEAFWVLHLKFDICWDKVLALCPSFKKWRVCDYPPVCRTFVLTYIRYLLIMYQPLKRGRHHTLGNALERFSTVWVNTLPQTKKAGCYTRRLQLYFVLSPQRGFRGRIN